MECPHWRRLRPQSRARSPSSRTTSTRSSCGTADTLSGFTIDLWDEISKRQAWNTVYTEVPEVGDQLQAVADGHADVGAVAISITSQREKAFDFSQPFLNAGLQILVPDISAQASKPGLRSFLDLLFSRMMLVWLSAALAITVLPAHILWLVERRHSDAMVARSYFPGIFQAFAGVWDRLPHPVIHHHDIGSPGVWRLCGRSSASSSWRSTPRR